MLLLLSNEILRPGIVSTDAFGDLNLTGSLFFFFSYSFASVTHLLTKGC